VTIEHRTPPQTTPEAADETRFFADHYMPVMRLCMRHLRDESDAEDAAQEVFRRAVQRRAELRGDPLPWLITVAKNVCRDELRRRRNGWSALERSAAMAPADEASTAVVEDNPERLVVGQLFVRDLLGRLTPAERRVLAARVYDGATGVDAAQVLGVSSSTTRVLLSRARQKLRAYLEEGQAAFAAIPLLGLRTLHSFRRALLQRPLAGEAGAALLLPAALVFTVMMGPGVSVPAGSGGSHVVALGGRPTAMSDAGRAATAAPVNATIYVRQQPPATPRPASSSPAHDSHAPLLPPLRPGYDQVAVSDIEPSPNYSSDHTVLMLGGSGTCIPPACTELFESTDDGVTWDYIGAPGLAGTSLVLPPSSFSRGTFYTWGYVGLQMTIDGGHTFVSAGPPMGGYATAAPAWSGLGVVLGNEALWELDDTLAPKYVSPFSADQQAAGPPLILANGAGGAMVLQPLTTMSDTSTVVLRCTPVCGASAPLPFVASEAALVPSPSIATDHTVFAHSIGGWLTVSHDDGQTFGAAKLVRIQQLVAVSRPGGRRLVASMWVDNTHQAVETSDDDGASWHLASVDPSLNLGTVYQVSRLAQNRLIASMMRTDVPGYFGFACSTDGSAWTSCASGHGG